jgi:hypothetical protein
MNNIFINYKFTIIKSFIVALFMFYICEIHAEYRVYQYMIKQSPLQNRDPQSYLVTTVLNPVSYQAYHGQAVAIDLLRTWICPGHTGLQSTGHQPLCTGPYSAAPKLEENPVNQNGETPLNL